MADQYSNIVDPKPSVPNTPPSPVVPPTQKAPSSPGAYKGITITAGSDADVAAQIAKIDAQQNAPQNNQPPSQPQPPTNSQSSMPDGWDAKSYANFKSANPNLEPNAEDTARMNGTYKSPEQTKVDNAQSEEESLSKQRLADAQSVHDQILGIQNGSIPLDTGEQSQIEGLKKQFQDMIDQQKLTNIGASGIANVRGYQTVAAEYDPTFQVKTIGAIVTAGNNKIADLNIKMASAVAALTQSFKDNDISKIQAAYKTLDDARKERQTTIQKTIDDTQKVIKEAQDQQQKITDNINKIAEDAAKNGASQKTIAEIISSGSTQGAILAAGDSLQTASGQLGDYLQYKREVVNSGLTPLDYGSWKDNEDAKASKLKVSEAYSTAYASASGKAAAEAKYSGGGTGTDVNSLTPTAQKALTTSGFNAFSSGTQDLAIQLVMGQLAPSELSKRTTGKNSYSDVLTAANKYSQAITGKPFNIAQADRDYKFAQRPQTQDTLNYLKSLVGTADQDGNISGGNLDELKNLSDSIKRGKLPALNDAKAWAKLATGNVQYAQYQTVATEVSDQVAKILQGGGSGGTSDAKLQQAINMFNTGFSKDQMAGVIESLKPLLANRAKSMVGDNPYLSDYAVDLGVKNAPITPKVSVNNYVKSNPKQAETIAKLYEVPGATDNDIYQYLLANKLIAQ